MRAKSPPYITLCMCIMPWSVEASDHEITPSEVPPTLRVAVMAHSACMRGMHWSLPDTENVTQQRC